MEKDLTFELTHSREVILIYLKEKMKKGKKYFRSKHIAAATGLSAKEVGSNLKILQEMLDDISIVRWGYAGSTTWLIEAIA